MSRFKNMSRTEKEKLKYDSIRLYTLDPVLARKARGWGSKRILNEIGIDIEKIKGTPKVKRLPPNYKGSTSYRRKKLELEKFQYLVASGYTIKEANKKKKESWLKIKKPPGAGKFRKITDEVWAKWSKNKDHPYTIRRSVEELVLKLKAEAKKKGEFLELDVNNKYPWFIMYEHYVNGKPLNWLLKTYKPSMGDSDFYVEIEKEKVHQLTGGL